MFENYTNEVIHISKAQNVDLDVAADKFVADVRAGAARPYNTAGDSKADFAALKAEFDRLDEQAQGEAIAALKAAVHAAAFPEADEA